VQAFVASFYFELLLDVEATLSFVVEPSWHVFLVEHERPHVELVGSLVVEVLVVEVLVVEVSSFVVELLLESLLVLALRIHQLQPI
jgi:hypothetical protein